MLDTTTDHKLDELIASARRLGARTAVLIAARKLRGLGENRAADLVLVGSPEIVAAIEDEMKERTDVR